MAHTAIEADNIVKQFGGTGRSGGRSATRALDGVDLQVPEGSVCALLGPNGAGKTTAVRVLSTLMPPDSGTVRVAGFDVVREAARVRYQIGMVGQQPSVDEILTGRENLRMWARLYRLDGRAARMRADELLEVFGLSDAAGKRVKHYSGGMRRRLDLAASFVLAPRVLFLDEPTTGLDPRSRTEVWAAVRDLVARGTTVLLTTQYLDEADRFAHQIAVLDSGAVIADDTPARLKSRIGGDQIDVVVRESADVAAAAAVIARIAEGAPESDADARHIAAPVREALYALETAARELREAGIAVEDLSLRRPTLDEVFLSLTQRSRADPGSPA
ncbi:ATP-binding cassette domain-containing protein [Nocardiopsis coralliicola]